MGIFEINWIWQAVTVGIILLSSYAILRHYVSDTKLIIVEFAVIILNLFLLFNVFTSNIGLEFVINISVSLSMLIFSFILVHSIYEDIRDRERIGELAKEMTLANERMKMMEQSKTEFVSIASHQLRTPLTVIKGYASMILEGTFGKIPDEARGAMEKLYKSSEKIVALVEDLLTVSRLEQGRMKLDFEVVNMDEIVRDVLSEAEVNIRETGLDFFYTVESGKIFTVSLDKKKFKQVFLHLLENAVKYTSVPGSVRVDLSTDSASSNVRLSVSDTGVGISGEKIQTLLEKFSAKNNLIEGISPVNNEQPLDQKTGGIGLYIAQEIIRAHRGNMHIESDGVDSGTTVVVELPKETEKVG